MKVAIYCRVSTQNQKEEEVPILGQLEECRKYAKEKGWEIVKVYEDAGYSGRTDQRPAFQEMFEAIKQNPKPFDIILTWRSNRLFRSVEHRLAYGRIFRRRGIRFVSLHEPEFEGASAQFMETVLAAADELYCKQVAEDTLRGLKQIASQGYSTGGRPPTGYRNVRVAAGLKPNGEPIMRTKWEPDPVAAPLVQRAFEMCIQGYTNVDIVNETQIVSAKNGLSTLLRNRAYLGERIYNTTRRADKKTIRIKNKAEDIVIVPESHPAIISQEIFDQVQSILDRKCPHKSGRQSVVKSVYILSGLLWCKEHNCPYTGQGNGELMYYSCAERKRLGKKHASCRWLKKEAIESFVINELMSCVFTPERIRQGMEYLAREQARNEEEDDTERDDILHQLKQIKTELERFYKAIADGVNPDAVSKPINDRMERKLKLEIRLEDIELERLRAANLPAVTDEAVNEMREKICCIFNSPDAQELKNALAHFIEKIEISGNEMTVTYSFGVSKTGIVPVGSDPRPLKATGTIILTIPGTVFPRLPVKDRK
ncbi:MAG: recombinase family protein [Dehalococcoidales bacterium]|nr:recombinase family protein [Dehalococcoidales bacterium]